MIDWIKEHPYLSGGLGLVLVILFIAIKNAASGSSSQPATATVSTGPDDSIQALELQSGAAVQTAQINANAAVAAGNQQLNSIALQAQVANLQTAGSVDVSNRQTQAALTLGLANGGQSTSSILQLLDAQLGNFPTLTAVAGNGNYVANPPVTVGVTVTGTGGGSTPVTGSTSGGFVSTPTMPWPSSASIGGNSPLNDLADSIALSEHGEPLVQPATAFTNVFGNGSTATDHTCPAGYYFQNGQCLSADSSPEIAENLAELAVTHYLPVANNADGSCPPGYHLVNNACYPVQ